MSKIRLAFTLTVDYTLNGETPATLKERLLALAAHAMGDGMLTGATEAEVDSWSAKVCDGKSTLVTEHHIAEGGTGIVDEPDFHGDVNDPQTIALWLHDLPHGARVHIDDGGLRLVQTGAEELNWLEIGGHTPERAPLDVDTFVDRLGSEGADAIIPEVHYRLLHQATDGDRLDEDFPCRLERNDKPAFRMGCNDYADQMQKDRQWVTFDNGGSYYTAADVKAAVAAFDGDDDEYERAPELKSIVEWWL